MATGHTIKAFDDELRQLRANISQMGGLAEAAIRGSMQALSQRNNEAAAEIVARDAQIDALEAEGRVVAYYEGGNPNGSLRDIAGIANAAGNVVGIMPHPEHAIEELTGPGTEGLGFFTSVLKALV